MKASKAAAARHEAQGSARILLALGVVLGLALIAAAAALIFPLEPDAPNIILISIDTLRHDRLGFAGHRPGGKSPSPFLDRLADEGAVFSHAVSTSSWTLPGHYALLTGLPDELHDMIDDRVPRSHRVRTMAQLLKGKGYKTGGFFSGPYLHPFFGFNRGFDWYESCMREETVYDVLKDRGKDLSKDERKELSLEKEMKSHLDITSEAVTMRAAYFSRKFKKERVFLFLHYFDVHNDYIPPPPYNRLFVDHSYDGEMNGTYIVRDPRIHPDMDAADLNHIKGLYDGEIAWVDHNIEVFFRRLREEAPEVLENCIVVITSDHGEEFFEHGLIGHRKNLYGVSLRVPLILWSPGLVAGGVQRSEPVRIYDVYPTLLDLAGLEVPEGVYGRSLAPLIRGEPFKHEPIVSELTFIPAQQEREYHKHFSFQLKHLKLVGFQRRAWSPERPIDFQGDLLESRFELYDLEQDPGEGENLFEENPGLAEKMKAQYFQEMARLRDRYQALHGAGPGEGQEPSEVPPELIQRIEGVGYGAGAGDQRGKQR